MLNKKTIWGLCVTLGHSLSAQEIADTTRIDIKEVRRHLKQLVKEKKLSGVRKFRVYQASNIHNARPIDGAGV